MQELRRMVVDFAVTDVDFGSTRSAMEPEPQPTTKYRARGPDKLQRKYRTEHLVNGLRMSINFKSQRPLKKVVHACIRYLHPRNFKRVVKTMEKSGHRDPAKDTLVRARVKFDVAAMIRHRRWSATAGQINRYLVCDASPQKSQSHEVICDL